MNFFFFCGICNELKPVSDERICFTGYIIVEQDHAIFMAHDDYHPKLLDQMAACWASTTISLENRLCFYTRGIKL